MTTAKELYSRIDPFVVERIRSIVTSSSAASTGTGSGTDSAALTAVRDASILVVNHTAALNNERALTVSGALFKSDGGPGSYLTISLATPGSLTADSANDASTNHTHAVTASAAPGATTSLLKSVDGMLTLPSFAATANVRSPLIDTASGGLSLSPSNGVVTVNNTLAATTKLQAPLLDTASGNLSLAPASGTTVVTGTLSATTAVQTPLINTSSGVDLTIAPSDDLILSPNVDVIMDVGTRIGTDNFLSGSRGWRVDYDGTGDFRRLFADELTVEVFISDVNLALAGSQFIAKSLGIVSQQFEVPTTNDTLEVFDLPGFNDTQNFEANDWVRLRYVDRGTGLDVGDAWGIVTSYTDLADGEQRWTWTRQSGTVGKTINAGMVAIDYGQSGDGYIHLTSLQANSPYLDIATWVTDPSNPVNHTVHVRLGNLDGITDTDLNPSGFGLYSENTFLKGKFVAGNGDVVIDNVYGINVGAFINTPDSEDYGKNLTFLSDPQSPSVANTVAQIRGIRTPAVSGFASRNTLQISVDSGDTTGIDESTIDLSVRGEGSTQLAGLSANADSVTGVSTVSIFAQNESTDDGLILLNGDVQVVGAFQPYALISAVVDIGAADNPFRRIYVDEVITDTIVGTPSYSHSHAASDITSGTLDLARIPTNLTGKNASFLEGYSASDFVLVGTTDGVQALTQGSGISITGTLANYTIGHADTSSATSADNSAGYVIQDLTFDTYGHVTALASVDLDGRYALIGDLSGYVPSTRTISAGAGLDGGGDLSANRTISHADTSSVTSADNSGGTVVQDLTFDGFGHTTAIASVNLDSRFMQTITQGSGISITGTAPSLTVSHADTSSAGGASNSGPTFIQSLTLDTYGHVTAISSGDASTALDDRFVNVTGDTMTGQLTVSTPTIVPPFVLGANNTNVTVVGLRADLLNRDVATGDGLQGGGELSADLSLSVDSTVARRNAANTFTDIQTISNAAAALHLDNLTNEWAIVGDTALEFHLDTVQKFAIGNDGSIVVTGDLTVQNVGSALYLDNLTTEWSIVGGTSDLGFYLDTVQKFNISSSGNIGIAGDLTVDGDTLYVDAATDAVWINSGTPDGTATLKATSGNAADIAAVFKAAASQTAVIWQIENSDGDGLIAVDAVGNLQSVEPAFVSGRTGWRLAPDGTAEFNNIIARGEIRTALFVKDEIAVDTGTHLFAEAARTKGVFETGPGTLSLALHDPPYEHASVFEVGDNLIIRTGGIFNYSQSTGPNINEPWNFFEPRSAEYLNLIAAEIWLQVTAITDSTTHYTYSVIQKAGPTVTLPENTTVVSFGQGDTGLIGIFADRGYGPYLDVFVPSVTPWSVDPRTTVRLGRLDGLGLPGLATEQYGIAIGTDLSDPDSPSIIASDLQFTMKNVNLTILNDADHADIQFALDDDSYFGEFFYDYDDRISRIGTATNSRIEHSFSPTADIPNQFAMYGTYTFSPFTGAYGEQGHVDFYSPVTYVENGWTLGNNVRSISTVWTSLDNFKMSGTIDGTESWSVDDFGEWSFADDEVRINGAGIRIHAASLTDADQNQLHWQSTAGALVAGIYGFVDDANDNRGLALRAESADVTASIGLTASSDFANASVSIEAFADGESRIEFGASRVDALGALYVNRVLVIRPGGVYSEPGGPMDGLYMYFDTNTNTLKAVFPNGSVRTLATG